MKSATAWRAACCESLAKLTRVGPARRTGIPSRDQAWRSKWSGARFPRRSLKRRRVPVVDPPDADAPEITGTLYSQPPALTADQATLFSELRAQLESGKFHVALLHGITGSGKTEIYLRLIARCLELGRSALML